jgi:Na+:H+ antiporter, NhaA family
MKFLPVLRSIKKQMNAGVVLLFAAAAALVIANSPLSDLYFRIFEETRISIDFGPWKLDKPLYYWINDGLMAIFFFLIGLEVKRELLVGELSSVKKASLPLVGAVGGMLVPALVFVAFNYNEPLYINGWAIPMATDIAFALGVIALLKDRVPIELKIFLVSLAVVDDIGAVLAIAVFYTEEISLMYLFIALGVFLFLFLLNRLGVRVFWVFIVIGIFGLWYPLLKSGVHATIAGVLLAFTIPLKRETNARDFLTDTQSALKNFDKYKSGESSFILQPEQYDSITQIRESIARISSPLQQIENSLHNFTLYFIMPLFAFANTGIRFSGIDWSLVFTVSLPIGIMLGLLLGKVVGVSLFVWLFRKLKLIKLPGNIKFRHIIGAGFLAGIGFTMSIFITDLAFHGDKLIDLSKMAILIASLSAGLLGYFLLRKGGRHSIAADDLTS